MIVDASALIAVVREESDALRYLEALRDAAVPARASAPTWFEARIVADGGTPSGGRRLDGLARAAHLEIVPFDEELARVARDAYRDFGRGSGHPAKLNFGDCFSYALASITGEPLLYKGDDFRHTDIRSALD